MGDLAESNIGGGTPKTSAKEYWGGTLPWIQSSDLIEDKLFNVDVKKHITNLGIKNSAAKLISQNSIAVVTRVGVGKLAFMPFEYATSQDFLSLSGIKGNPQFVTYTFQIAIKRLAHQLQGTSIKGITKSELLKVPIKVPLKKAEQDHISKLFFSLDNTLQLHERKCEELALIKKALLQKLFPKKDEFKPEVRYKNFSDAWEQRKLGEVATFINGRAYKQNELLDFGKYKVLRVGNFYTNDSWYYSNLELADKYYIDKGDLVYTWSATFGPHIWDGEKVIYHYHIWKIVLSESLDRDFTLQILEADKAKLLANTNGSTMIHVTKKDMESKFISLPNIEEQKHVGYFFNQLDTLIALHQRKLEKLKQLKKFLLQNMFI